MSTVSPLFDASIAGSLANASLCTSSRNGAPARAKAAQFDAAAHRDGPASAIACRTRWSRLVDTVLSPISGPTFERASGAAGKP